MKDGRIAGRLRERVAFDAPLPGGTNAFGEQEFTWSEARTCRAEFIYLRGSEVIEAARLEGRSVFKVRIRALGSALEITSKHRMRTVARGLPEGEGIADDLPGQRYNIQEVDKIADRKWIFLVVESIQ